MFADPTLLKESTSEVARFDRQAFLNAIRRGNSLPGLAGAPEESDRAVLMEYADFLIEQESCYCQQ
jgi:hypothetical protein